MGVVYKLKPEITGFILSTRKNNPRLGCRAIASLVEKKYKTPISKSSVNDVIKSIGLSMPVGRRRKSRRNEVFGRGLGAILLKGADYLLGGVQVLAEAIKKKSSLSLADIRTGLEYLLYSPLFMASEKRGQAGTVPGNRDSPLCSHSPLGLESGLWPLINCTAQPPGDIVSLSRKLREQDVLSADIARHFFTCVNSVRSIKVVLSDSQVIYLDGQSHTVWPQPKIPYKFSTTIFQARLLMHDYAQGRTPLAFFMAPGYDAPTKEFFNFLKGAVSSGNKITAFSLLGSNAQELEELKLPSGKKDHFFFGLWPWQFSGLMKINLSGDFRPFYFEPLKESLHIAPASVELFQEPKGEALILKGCALKSSPGEEIRLVILTNYSLDNYPQQTDPPTADSLDNIVSIYLGNWPNFESTFQDMSRKIELKEQGKSFEEELQSLARHVPLNLDEMLKTYLEILNLFVVFYLLPPVYRDTDLLAMKDHFYGLSAVIKAQKGCSSVHFQPPPGYPFLKELHYACRRLNEKMILSQEGQRLWFLL